MAVSLRVTQPLHSTVFSPFRLMCQLQEIKEAYFPCVLCSFQMWQFAPNSLHYLLSLWQRMVASMPYVKNTEPHLLETYAPEVTS